MNQQDLLQSARQGDARAISILISQALEPRGIRVRATRDSDRIHVLLEADHIPNQQLANVVRGGIACLGASSIRSIRVYGRQTGHQLPAWTQEWALQPPIPSPVSPPTSPLTTASPKGHSATVHLPSPPSPTTYSSNVVDPPNTSTTYPPTTVDPAYAPEQPRSPSTSNSSTNDPLPPTVNHQRLAYSTFPRPSLASPASPSSPISPVSPPDSIPSSTTRPKPARVPRSPVPSSPHRVRRRGLVVPFAFAAGFVLGIGWDRFLASQLADLLSEASSDPYDTGNSLQAERTIALTPSVSLSPSTEVVVDSALPPVATPTVPPLADVALTIKAVGDIIPGTNFPSDRLPAQDGLWLFDGVKDFLQGSDILFGNFESTLTDYPHSAKDTSQGQTFAFRTPPAYANLLRDVGFDVLSVANNHSLDFGDQGFEDTIAHVQQTGMQAVGRKGEIVYRTVKDVTVAFIAFSYFPDHNSLLDLDAGRALVAEASTKADIVVISVHAGAEGSDAIHTRNETEFFFGENRGNMVEFAHAMVDQGADLILGHGPHVPRALELYRSRLIAYSLGNFMGYRTLSTDGTLGYSLILDAQLSNQGEFVTGRVIPVRLDAQGVPFVDDGFKSVSFIRSLIESDFPVTPLLIDEAGQILRNEAPI